MRFSVFGSCGNVCVNRQFATATKAMDFITLYTEVYKNAQLICRVCLPGSLGYRENDQ